MELIDLVAVVAVTLSGFNAGTQFFTQFSLVPAYLRAPAGTYVWYHRAMVTTADRFMPMLVLSGAVTAGIVAGVHYSQSGGDLAFVLLLIGALGCLSVAPLTIALNHPVNLAMRRADPDAPPADWAEKRAAWNRGHVWRTCTSAI